MSNFPFIPWETNRSLATRSSIEELRRDVAKFGSLATSHQQKLLEVEMRIANTSVDLEEMRNLVVERLALQSIVENDKRLEKSIQAGFDTRYSQLSQELRILGQQRDRFAALLRE